MGHLQGTLELNFVEIFRKVMYAHINLYILFFCWAEHVYSGPVLAVGHPFIFFFSAELSTFRPTQVSDSNCTGHTLMIYRLNWTRRGSPDPVLSVGHPLIFLFFLVELNTFTPVSDSDCPGNTLVTHSGLAAHECAEYCYQNPECVAFTWQESNPFTCDLKQTCDPFSYKDGVDTYVRPDGESFHGEFTSSCWLLWNNLRVRSASRLFPVINRYKMYSLD